MPTWSRTHTSTWRKGSKESFTHDIAFDSAGVLYHLTQTADHGWHLLERYERSGHRLRPVLVPGRDRGGAYLAALLPTSHKNAFWSYHPMTGKLYRVRLTWEP